MLCVLLAHPSVSPMGIKSYGLHGSSSPHIRVAETALPLEIFLNRAKSEQRCFKKDLRKYALRQRGQYFSAWQGCLPISPTALAHGSHSVGQGQPSLRQCEAR